ncbi:hypothetical protein L3Y34_019540 [Caenorhabditis briggsae]|uniref:Uncharacterized protein n=1 Tax=Caenorhabditis briggsae TaxID=6238 RepID=A0AAE9IWU4_CAEBR|nr:hypothetical protein L3Y34_019540 [Caenorhabditis briggsae]
MGTMKHRDENGCLDFSQNEVKLRATGKELDDTNTLDPLLVQKRWMQLAKEIHQAPGLQRAPDARDVFYVLFIFDFKTFEGNEASKERMRITSYSLSKLTKKIRNSRSAAFAKEMDATCQRDSHRSWNSTNARYKQCQSNAHLHSFESHVRRCFKVFLFKFICLQNS